MIRKDFTGKIIEIAGEASGIGFGFARSKSGLGGTAILLDDDNVLLMGMLNNLVKHYFAQSSLATFAD